MMPASRPLLRSTTGMFGAGYLEMLARQMTEELQRTRDSIRHGETKDLVAKGVHFGKLTLTKAERDKAKTEAAKKSRADTRLQSLAFQGSGARFRLPCRASSKEELIGSDKPIETPLVP